MQTRQIRLLREKHGITLAQLSHYCDASPQRLSQIELGTVPITIHMRKLIQTAFNGFIASKQQELTSLKSDFRRHKHTLLDFVDKEESP